MRGVSTLKIGILVQNKFGGTDELISRFNSWAVSNNNNCTVIEDDFDRDMRFDCVLLPTSEIGRLISYLFNGLSTTKIFIWSMGHGAYRSFFYDPNKTKSRALKCLYDYIINIHLKKIISLKSIAFTDEVGFHYDIDNVNFSHKVSDYVVPIAIDGVNFSNDNRSKVYTAGYNCCWIGRISHDFKVEPLIDLINDASEDYGEGFKVRKFYIVGSGDAIEYLKCAIHEINPYFDIVYIDHMQRNDLHDFIVDKVDISFAMGTSALDTANFGIPTIIVKPYSANHKKVGVIDCKKKYRFIFESKGFSLGEFPYTKIKPSQPDVGFRCIIDDIVTKDYCELSLKSKIYSEGYNSDDVFKKLMKNISEAEKYQLGLADVMVYAFHLLRLSVKKLLCRVC